MKKFIVFCLLGAMLFSTNALAENVTDMTQEEFAQESAELLTKISLNIEIGEVGNLYPKNLVLGIYSENGDFWGANHIWVSRENSRYSMTFDVPEYKKGDKFKVGMFSGAQIIEYNGVSYKENELFDIDTGEDIIIRSTPLKASYVKCYANGWELYFRNPAKIIDNTCMIPLDEYLQALEMTQCKYETLGRVEVNANNHSVVFFVDGNDMYKDDNVTYTDVVPTYINGVFYVPFRFLVEGLGGNISVSYGEILNVNAELRLAELKASELFVKDIKSKTNNLIWVSKKNFQVTVFENRNGVWVENGVYPCSIGAPATPTVTGEFEYFSKEKGWYYDTYYVAPVMRFYRGYALHSTLLRYNGNVADGRLGKKISHGCVRMRPEDINNLANSIPLYTKVYVTE